MQSYSLCLLDWRGMLLNDSDYFRNLDFWIVKYYFSAGSPRSWDFFLHIYTEHKGNWNENKADGYLLYLFSIACMEIRRFYTASKQNEDLSHHAQLWTRQNKIKWQLNFILNCQKQLTFQLSTIIWGPG